ncbi:MAG: hypothetical protein AB1726_15360 [Planctomycetota bacterium]
MTGIDQRSAAAWNEALRRAVLGAQRAEGSARGSWDPVGPWGWAGGRVYSTAMMALSLAESEEGSPGG